MKESLKLTLGASLLALTLTIAPQTTYAEEEEEEDQEELVSAEITEESEDVTVEDVKEVLGDLEATEAEALAAGATSEEAALQVAQELQEILDEEGVEADAVDVILAAGDAANATEGLSEEEQQVAVVGAINDEINAVEEDAVDAEAADEEDEE